MIYARQARQLRSSFTLACVLLLLTACAGQPPKTPETKQDQALIVQWCKMPYGDQLREGDIVEYFRWWDGQAWAYGQPIEVRGNEWKILQITRDHVEMELVKGEYRARFGGRVNTAGYRGRFSNSLGYQRINPEAAATEQVLRALCRIGSGAV